MILLVAPDISDILTQYAAGNLSLGQATEAINHRLIEKDRQQYPEKYLPVRPNCF